MSTLLIIGILAYLILGRIFSILITTPLCGEPERIVLNIFWIIVLSYLLFTALADWLYLRWAYFYYIRHNISRAKNESFSVYLKRAMDKAKKAKKDYEKEWEEWDDVRWRPHQNR